MPRPPLPKGSRLESKKAQASMIMPSEEDQPEKGTQGSWTVDQGQEVQALSVDVQGEASGEAEAARYRECPKIEYSGIHGRRKLATRAEIRSGDGQDLGLRELQLLEGGEWPEVKGFGETDVPCAGAPRSSGGMEESGDLQHLWAKGTSGEDDHTTFSPSSPDTEKKRSAFEDLTNGITSFQPPGPENLRDLPVEEELGGLTYFDETKRDSVLHVHSLGRVLAEGETSQSQTVQSKKEDDTEHGSHVSMRISKKVDKISLRKRKGTAGPESSQSQAGPGHVTTQQVSEGGWSLAAFPVIAMWAAGGSKVGLVTSLSNVEKQFILDIPTKSKTLTTKEPSVFQKTLVLNKEPVTEETRFLKKTLQSRACHQKTFLAEKPLILLEETEDYNEFDAEPMTTSKKNPEEADITEKMIDLNMPLRKLTVTLSPLPLKNKYIIQEKYTVQGKSSVREKSLALKVPATREKSVIRKPFFKKKNPTTEMKSLLQEPSLLQEKCNAQGGESSILKKPWVLRENTNNKDDALAEPVTSKGKHSTKEATNTKQLSSFKNNHDTQGKGTREHEPLSYKNSNTKKDSHFQGPSALQKRHSSPGVLSKSKKLCGSQKRHIEKSHVQLASAFKKQRIMEEPASTLKPLTSEMQQTFTQGTVFHFQNPRVLLTDILRSESLRKELLPFKKENIALPKKKCTTPIIPLWPAQSEWLEKIDETRNFLPKKPRSLRNETITRFQQNPSSPNEKYSIPQKLCPAMPSVSEEKTTSQEGAHSTESVTLNDDKEFFSPELFSPYGSADEDTLKVQKSLDFQEKTDRKNDTHTNLLASQDSVSDEELFLRKLFCKDRYPSSTELSQQKAAALEQEFVLRQVLDESSSGGVDKSLSNQSLCFPNYSSTKEEASEEPLNMPENMAVHMESSITQGNSIQEAAVKKHTTDAETQSKKFLTLQETTSIEEVTLKELVASQEKPRAEMVTVLKELLVVVKNPSVEKISLITQEKQLSNVEDLLSEVLELVEKPTVKESTLEEPLVLQENPSTKTEASLKEALALKENPSIEKANCKASLTFDHKPDIEKDDVTRETLTVEESAVPLALNEGLTAADELSFSDLPALEDTTVIDSEDFSKSFLIFPPDTSPNMSSNALASKQDNSSAAMACVENFIPLMNSSPYDSDSEDFQSAQGIRLPEIITLDDSDSLESIEREDRNPACNSVYIKEIFSYLKKREEKFIVGKYMEQQMELTSTMRAIVVDWLVEVQTSFQMSNETLYLAVKLMDCYLMKAQCKKNRLQFLASTVYMIATKFEESYPPTLPEFLYLCEDVYEPCDMASLEMNILETLDFDINIPTAYHFLRRYTTCTHASMKTLTLSRFICEITLLDYEFIQERPSKLAAACLALALYMRNLDNCIPLLEHYTHYKIRELCALVLKLNSLVTFQPNNSLKNVYEKYSEENFFEVAKIPPLDMNYLEEILHCALLS
ncbi:G2/mitotic-specific cyclin-B3 [Arvicola amphibius]|uniref:G2/mitotic-specific cyclin-B3 n=1 Tax=Arvicola amphibius TaxID=1047088 RepID=UPI001C0883BB|nr:G2/mitotic-specific cyclin-B3 [Arvicola amphibius]